MLRCLGIFQVPFKDPLEYSSIFTLSYFGNSQGGLGKKKAEKAKEADGIGMSERICIGKCAAWRLDCFGEVSA